MKRLWLAFAVVLVFSFSILGWVGTRIYQEAPPLPDQVVATNGKVVIPNGDIGKGQNVWQAMGGMQVGSIWGHGSYVAPDWSADWLHRECVFILDEWANTGFQKEFGRVEPERQAQLQKRLELLMRTNTFDPATQTIKVALVREKAFEDNLKHYTDVFTNGNVKSLTSGISIDLPTLPVTASTSVTADHSTNTSR